MAHVAREMERDDWCRCKRIPLLIGGATTSRVHTAVKIAPHYSGPVIWVPDASRSVPVAQSLTSDAGQKQAYLGELLRDYRKIRERHAAKTATPILSLAKARANAPVIDFSASAPPRPKALGRRVLKAYDLNELADTIDWTPFFQTWDLAGSFPAILDDEVVGAQARQVYADGKNLLSRLIGQRKLSANGVFGLFRAQRTAPEDITLYADDDLSRPLLTWNGLRQQTEKPAGEANKCLADVVAPHDSGVADYAGMFAVCITGAESLATSYEAAGDDYNAILVKALADRLAEAFAERLHQRVRKEFWAYAPAESLSNEDLIAERYQGIRPAPGYPSCPDHSIKSDLFRVLRAHEIGMQLTENLAMVPASSVSGFYLWHPQSSYFNLGPINDEQLQDYCSRAGIAEDEGRRRLAPCLGL
jgi:5-methyltetrahydrofolate--homocysteine methyltransferase